MSELTGILTDAVGEITPPSDKGISRCLERRFLPGILPKANLKKLRWEACVHQALND